MVKSRKKKKERKKPKDSKKRNKIVLQEYICSLCQRMWNEMKASYIFDERYAMLSFYGQFPDWLKNVFTSLTKKKKEIKVHAVLV